MTSNSSASAEPIRLLAVARGVAVLEAPVGRGVSAAEGGSLKLFVGGDVEVLERHHSLLEILGDPHRIVQVGGPGAGYTTKLLVNLLWFGQAVATGEALLLAKRAGIDLCCAPRWLTAPRPATSSGEIRDESAQVGRTGAEAGR